MHFGVSMFHTDSSIPAVEFARALEARGFESLCAPELSRLPVPRRTPFPGGGELPRPYSEVMDSFRRAQRSRGGDEDPEARDWRVPRCAARSDPDSKTGRLDRPGIERPLSVWRGRRLECRGNRGPRTAFKTRSKLCASGSRQ
jgi:hypothetical protein